MKMNCHMYNRWNQQSTSNFDPPCLSSRKQKQNILLLDNHNSRGWAQITLYQKRSKTRVVSRVGNIDLKSIIDIVIRYFWLSNAKVLHVLVSLSNVPFPYFFAR